jgi:hypothetical protein
MSAATYRRPGSEARHVRNLVFERLPSVVRDRLASCLASGGAPTPLLVDASRRSPPSAGRWRVLAALAVVAEGVLWFKGFGDATSPFAVEKFAFAAGHAAALFVLLFSMIRALRIARGQGGAPFPDGRYLFALDLVEVDGPRVRLTELHTLRRVEARHGKRGPAVVLVFADAHEVVFEGQRKAEVLAVTVKSAIDAAVALVLPDDQPRMNRIDPFFELRVSDDWASAEVDAKATKTWVMRAPLPAVSAALFVLSAVLGVGLHTLRNRLSDDEMFVEAIEIADRTNDPHRWKIGEYSGVRHVDEIDAIRFERARGDAEALIDYLRHGGAREAKADEALFDLGKHDPTALKAAIQRGGPGAARAEDALYELRKGDLDELVTYIRSRGARAEQADDQLFALAKKSGEPKSYRFYLAHGKRHRDEVQSALLPDAEYAEAAKASDVVVLSDFVREYPDSAHAAEIKAKIHGLYADALRVFRETKPSAAGLRFVTVLLAELEERGDPSVNLDVDAERGQAIMVAGAKLAQLHGADYLPMDDDFDELTMHQVQGEIRSALVQRLASSFPNGTVTPRGAGLGAETGRPRIEITIMPVAADAQVSPHARLRVADVRFQIAFYAVVPSRPEELSWRFTTPGVKVFDGASNLEEPAGAVDGNDLARRSYTRMRIEGAAQIVDRIEKDL